MTQVDELQCSNPDCRVAETNKCVEGLSLDECPRYNRDAVSVAPEKIIETDVEGEASDDLEEPISLPSGERLTVPEASAVLRSSRETRVLAIIGPTDSGKTSLIASVYDLFQKGPIGDIHFARSKTLYAFEQACHHARAVSQRNIPDMDRTPMSRGVGFYHIGIRNGSASDIIDLMLADRAGESYRSAADDPSVSAKFFEVQRADSVTVLVDGKRIIGLATRHNVRSEIEMILQGLVDGDTVCQGQRIALVLTKLDEVEGSDRKEKAKRDFDAIVQNVSRLFGNVFSEIKSFQVAASPQTDILPRGYGVLDLLRFWIPRREVVHRILPPPPKSSRAIGRLSIIED